MSKHEITEVTSLGLDVIYMYNVLFTTASLKLSFAVFIFWGQCNYRQDDPVQHIISRKTTTTTTSTTTTTTQQQQQRQQEKEQLRGQKQDNDDYISSINTTMMMTTTTKTTLTTATTTALICFGCVWVAEKLRVSWYLFHTEEPGGRWVTLLPSPSTSLVSEAVGKEQCWLQKGFLAMTATRTLAQSKSVNCAIGKAEESIRSIHVCLFTLLVTSSSLELVFVMWLFSPFLRLPLSQKP